MAAMTLEALLKRAERAETKRQAFARLMQDCHAYALPERDSWNAYGYGQERTLKVYDSTAVVSTSRFANRLVGALFPSQQRWAQLTLPPELDDDDVPQDVTGDLQAATNKLFAHIHASNFDVAINEWAQEMAAGTACLLIENGRLATKRTRAPLLRFQAVPAGKVGFDEGPFGAVEGVFYQQTLPARVVRRTYPDAKQLPECVTKAEKEDPDKEIQLLQCTYYDAEDDVFRFEVIEKGDKARFVERTYQTMPWVIARWTKAPGETHGRGPLTQALPDIRTVNKLVELMLKSGSIAVAGVWTAVDDGVLNPANVRLTPGSVNAVRSNGGNFGPSLKALEFPGNFQLNEAMQEKMQTRIRQVLFDNPLPPEVEVGLTATEVIERVRRFQSDTGAFGRLYCDAVQPVIVRCLDILEEAGQLASPRFAGLMKQLRNDAVRVRATGPLSQAQDQADVQAVMQIVGGMASLGEFGAAMLRAAIDPEKAGRHVAERMGIPAKLVPTKDELAEQRDQAAEQAQGAALLQSPAIAQVAGALAKGAVQGGAPEAEAA